MTFVLETYTDGDGRIAEISQEKFSAMFDVEVYKMHNGTGIVEYENSFLTKQNARRAIRRNYPAMKREEK